MRFTIDRKKWLRGEGGEESRLLRETDGMMCCMGQVCLQLGVPEAKLKEFRTVMGIAEPPELLTQATGGTCPPRDDLSWVRRGYAINDDRDICDPEREKLLSNLFSAHGHELVFTD